MKRIYIVGLLLSVALFISTAFMPKSWGDTPPMLMGLSVVLFAFFLIALIISSIKSRIRRKPAPSATAPVQPVAPRPVAPAEKRPANIERVHVRGLSYYTKNIVEVATENPDYSLTKRELAEDFLDERVWQYSFFVKAALVPEPDNEYDPNAIMVQADGLCIGHVPAGSTAHIRNLMESGSIKSMDLDIGGGRYKEVSEVDDGEYELYKGENNYSAVLVLHLNDKSDSSQYMEG